ncbi:unnamed protein product [Strongylus vulgaris]|uniref:SCP domain-containing protein n=1 Tax=Strongylus vulgaris TaxID=40348 RepID=A0A3P7JLJ2_STRVU|nr:unnamed protein product [Strongylus vulgaris]
MLAFILAVCFLSLQLEAKPYYPPENCPEVGDRQISTDMRYTLFAFMKFDNPNVVYSCELEKLNIPFIDTNEWPSDEYTPLLHFGKKSRWPSVDAFLQETFDHWKPRDAKEVGCSFKDDGEEYKVTCVWKTK